MSATVTITIRAELFKRLQGFAEPLVDTVDTVLEKILDNWEHNPPSTLMELARLHDNMYANWGPSAAAGEVSSQVLMRNNLAHGVRTPPKVAGGGIALSYRQLHVIQAYLEQYYDRGIVTLQKNFQLPIGLPLAAEYQGRVLRAEVTEGGIKFGDTVYDSPSAAAVAAKVSLGADAKAAQTNGWNFWTFGRGTSVGAFPISVIRTSEWLDDARAKVAAAQHKPAEPAKPSSVDVEDLQEELGRQAQEGKDFD